MWNVSISLCKLNSIWSFCLKIINISSAIRRNKRHKVKFLLGGRYAFYIIFRVVRDSRYIITVNMYLEYIRPKNESSPYTRRKKF